jgi:hypothetical protein
VPYDKEDRIWVKRQTTYHAQTSQLTKPTKKKKPKHTKNNCTKTKLQIENECLAASKAG